MKVRVVKVGQIGECRIPVRTGRRKPGAVVIDGKLKVTKDAKNAKR